MKKRILSLLTCLALCLTLLPVTTLAANTVSYIYYQWNENTQTLSGPIDGTAATATEVTASDTAWDSNTTGGWYVAQGEVTINQRVTVTGEVHLILADGCTLTVNGGVQVADNDNDPSNGSSNSLTIYGQSGGTGKLIATLTGGSCNAAIGGNGQKVEDDDIGGIGAPGGTVTIHGGTVTAQSYFGAGIGGGSGPKGLGKAGTFSTSANGTNGNAVIFASSATGSNHIQATEDTQNPWQGVIFQGNEGKVYGTNITPTEDFTIPSGKTLTIASGQTLNIPEGVTLTNEGTLTVSEGGTLTVSEGGKLTVEQGGTLTGSVNGSTPPTISGQLTDQTVTEGSTATFTVTASAGEDGNTDTLTYQWQQSTGSGGTWTDISGATSASYTTKATTTSMSGDQYRCVVTSAASRVSVVSSAAALTVTEKPEPTTYTITADVDPVEAGSVTVNGSGISATVQAGSTVNLAATPNAGYRFVGWFESGTTVSTNTSYTFTANSDRSLTAQFDRISSGGGSSDPTYSITLPSRVTGGSVTATKRYAEKGETFRFTVTPDEGYELDTLTVTDSKGKEIDLTYMSGNEYTFQMPAGRVEIKVSFREIVVEPEPLPFTDVSENAWYAEAVRYVYAHGLMEDTSATAFSPDATTSRSMIAAILWRMAGSPVVNYAMDYTDVAQGQWYSEAIRWAASEGIVGGYGNGLFGTNDPITREQFAVMLYRYAQEQGYDVSVGENTNILSYTDAADSAEYAIPAMQWAVGAGLITGTGDGSTLTPQGQATRAQAAVMLMRFCEKYVNW